jgi:hypothetical protein
MDGIMTPHPSNRARCNPERAYDRWLVRPFVLSRIIIGVVRGASWVSNSGFFMDTKRKVRFRYGPRNIPAASKATHRTLRLIDVAELFGDNVRVKRISRRE